MISCPTVSKNEIRFHYDVATVFYRLLWGRHIHHGLWEAQEPAWAAAQRLTDTLAHEARIAKGDAVLDVGCGMGGSSIHLAREIGLPRDGRHPQPLSAILGEDVGPLARCRQECAVLMRRCRTGGL